MSAVSAVQQKQAHHMVVVEFRITQKEKKTNRLFSEKIQSQLWEITDCAAEV